MSAIVVDATFVGDSAVGIGVIAIGAAVFGDFERRGFVFAGDAENEIVEAVRPNLPGEIGERAFVGIGIIDAGSVFAHAGRNGGDKLAAVVVDAEKIERGAAELHVAGLDGHEIERIVARKGFGVFAVKSGVDEPDVAERVGAIGGQAIGVACGGGLAIGHAEGGADLELGIDGFDGAQGLAPGRC